MFVGKAPEDSSIRVFLVFRLGHYRLRAAPWDHLKRRRNLRLILIDRLA